MKLRKLPKNRCLRFCWLMMRRYLRHGVGIQSAALAFYLLFMIFPLLIFISALLGTLELDVSGMLLALREFLPADIVDFLQMYLRYVVENSSIHLMLFGLIFSVYFPMRATNVLMRAVRTAYHLGPIGVPLLHWIKTLLYTVALMISLILTLALMTVGERILWYAVSYLHLPYFAAQLWTGLRFPAAAVVGCFAVFLLYALTQDHRQPFRNLWPGAAAALTAWMVLSWLYSLYVDRIAHYSALYGSIGAIIVLLIWLQMSAVVLIMGAEMNGTLMALRKDRKGEQT